MNKTTQLTRMVTAALLLAPLAPLRAEPRTAFHVAVNGDDSNPGTEKKPFGTVSKAKEAVRTLNSDMKADIIVFIHAGDYFLSKSIVFDNSDSGKNGHQVCYRSCDGFGKARFIGGKRIKEWTKHSDNIYKTNVGAALRFDTMYENGQRARLARHPNTGYMLARASGGNAKLQFGFKPGDIPRAADTANTHVLAWLDGNNWDNDRVGVKSVDFAKGLVTLKREAHGSLTGHTRFYMEGALEFLDAPGEFYLEKATGMLYYWPMSKPIKEQEIIVPQASSLIRAVGTSPEKAAENLSFEGLTLTCSNYDFDDIESGPGKADHGIVYLENARNIKIQNCRILGAGLHGINMRNWAQNNTVCGNEIVDTGFSGVNMVVSEPTIHEPITGNKISNNRIWKVGRLYHGFVGGVYVSYSGHNEISYNDIRYSPRYSVSLKGKAYSYLAKTKTIDGKAVTFENRKDFIPTRNNVVKFNDISCCNLDSQDSGIIEAWGCGKDNRIENNRLHDSGSFELQSGIYLDDDASYTVVKDNIIYGLAGGNYKKQPMYIKGYYNVITNNICDASTMDWDFLTMHYGGDGAGHLTVTNNIFYNTGKAECAFQFWTWGKDRFDASDNNVFLHGCGRYAVWGVPNISTFAEWRKLSGGKYDQHSVIADPLFVNAAAHNHRLKADSPALKLGFKQIDEDSIGLKADFPYKDLPK